MPVQLQQLLDKMNGRLDAIDPEAIDSRFKSLADRLDLQEESTAGQIKLLRTDLGIVNENVNTVDKRITDLAIKQDKLDSRDQQILDIVEKLQGDVSALREIPISIQVDRNGRLSPVATRPLWKVGREPLIIQIDDR